MFRPVIAVFLSLVVLQGLYLFGDINDRSQIERALAEAGPLAVQAQKINQVVEDLGKDLLNLASAKNAEAAKIVSELNIKMNEPAPR